MNALTASLRRMAALISKEYRQLARDRLTFAMIVGIPAIQLIVFGYAIDFDARHLPAGVADQAQTHYSRALVMDIGHSQVLEFKYSVGTPQELETLMRRGDIRIGVFIPADFERRRVDTTRPIAQLLIDGSDPVLLGIANRLADIGAPSRPGATTTPSPRIAVRNYYNPERRSAVNTVPGLIGVILTLTMVLFTAVAIVRERERGNLEMLIATPIRTPELMIAKIVPYLGIGLLQVTVILLLGAWMFSVPIAGSLLDVYLASLLFIAASLGIGLFISTISQTQFQAIQMMFFILLPSILISGFVFPFEGMPVIVQKIAETLPMTHFVRLIKGIMLRGATLTEMAPSMWALAVTAVVVTGGAMLRFKKRID
jgi:ABC-2 type transport system permease protein